MIIGITGKTGISLGIFCNVKNERAQSVAGTQGLRKDAKKKMLFAFVIY